MNGFLGTRASLMLDVVFLAMFAVIPVMSCSIWLVKYRRRFLLHKRIQITLGIVLLVTVAAFEADMLINGWDHRAFAPPATEPAAKVYYMLYVHLVFAVSSALLWIWVIVQAQRKFPQPPAPCAYSSRHIFWARIAAIDMTCTAVTGWTFYAMAFV